MAEKYLYVLAGYDDETEKRLSDIQNRLYGQGFTGIQTKDIPMHFTLGSYETERESELKERLIRLSASQKAFDTGFNHIGLFRLPGNDVLFAAPEVSREMLELKDHFSDNRDVLPWSPHTTFLIDRPEEIARALKVVMEDFRAFTGKVTALHLYEFQPARHVLSVRFRQDEQK